MDLIRNSGIGVPQDFPIMIRSAGEKCVCVYTLIVTVNVHFPSGIIHSPEHRRKDRLLSLIKMQIINVIENSLIIILGNISFKNLSS